MTFFSRYQWILLSLLCMILVVLFISGLKGDADFRTKGETISVEVTHVRRTDFWFKYNNDTLRYIKSFRYGRGFLDLMNEGDVIQMRVLKGDEDQFRYPAYEDQTNVTIILLAIFLPMSVYGVYKQLTT